MDPIAPPVVSRSRVMGLVWLVPLIAMLVGGYLVRRELMADGPRIRIEFKDAAGVSVDRTKLLFKGIVIGVVSDLHLKNDQSGVVVVVELIPGAGSLARTGSRFWIRKPEVSLKGVRGLDTLFSGVSLAVQPGKGSEATSFVGLDHAPAGMKGEGTEYELRTPHRHGFDVGTPVAFRGIVVGRVLDYELAPDARAVLVRIQVDAPHDNLVRANTVFWNSSGLDMKMGLFSGLRLRDGGVESILSGAISFATPSEPGPLAPTSTRFELADRVDEDWLKWDPAFGETAEASTNEAATMAPAHHQASPGITGI